MEFDFNGKWTEDRLKSFLTYLESFSDEKYKAFHKKLIPGEEKLLGIRTPILKNVAKEVYKGDYGSFLDIESDVYDIIMIKAFVIGKIKDMDESLKRTKEFLPLIRNWAICDGFCASLKNAKKEPERFFDLVKKCAESEKEYYKRFGYVMLLDYYVDDEHIDFVLDTYESSADDRYYVNMATAWGISVCYVKFPEKTMDMLKKSKLDAFTYNKAIQKICESFRVKDEEKIILKKKKKEVDR